MDNTIQRKAKMILAGLAAVPAVGLAANANQIQSNSYSSPYSEGESAPSERATFTGLSRQELNEASNLVAELNGLDVVTVKELNLTKVHGIPYRYNMPEESALQNAREKNLERLAKLRSMIEAAK